MIGRLLCSLGLHRVVTTREGKVPGSIKARQPQGAASFIHCFCHRVGCKYHIIIDTHSNEKVLHLDSNGRNAA